jgi:hypothetical protein
METKVFHCTCKSDYQDEVYGKGNRLFNPRGKGDKIDGYRCTVCGKEINDRDKKK